MSVVCVYFYTHHRPCGRPFISESCARGSLTCATVSVRAVHTNARTYTDVSAQAEELGVGGGWGWDPFTLSRPRVNPTVAAVTGLPAQRANTAEVQLLSDRSVHHTNCLFGLYTTQTVCSVCTPHKLSVRSVHHTNCLFGLYTTRTVWSVSRPQKLSDRSVHHTNCLIGQQTTETAWSVCTPQKLSDRSVHH